MFSYGSQYDLLYLTKFGGSPHLCSRFTKLCHFTIILAPSWKYREIWTRSLLNSAQNQRISQTGKAGVIIWVCGYSTLCLKRINVPSLLSSGCIKLQETQLIKPRHTNHFQIKSETHFSIHLFPITSVILPCFHQGQALVWQKLFDMAQ